MIFFCCNKRNTSELYLEICAMSSYFGYDIVLFPQKKCKSSLSCSQSTLCLVVLGMRFFCFNKRNANQFYLAIYAMSSYFWYTLICFCINKRIKSMILLLSIICVYLNIKVLYDDFFCSHESKYSFTSIIYIYNHIKHEHST